MKNQEKVKMIWSRVTKGSSAPYSKMKEDQIPGVDTDLKNHINKEHKNVKTKPSSNESPGEDQKGKKEKKKRKGWKRFRHVALMTCRYIGMGVSHLGPVSTYPAPDYTIDPTGWYNAINRHYPTHRYETQHHWTTGIILSGW